MNEEAFAIPSICLDCINWNGSECILMPAEEDACLSDGAELFVEKEEEE